MLLPYFGGMAFYPWESDSGPMRFLCLLPTGLLVLLIIGVLAGIFIHLPLSQALTTLASKETRFALRLTLLTSGAATMIAVLLGVPAGHFLARQTFKGKLIIDTLIDLPMTMTPLVIGVGLLFLLGSEGVRHTLDRLGIELLFTPWGAVLTQVLIVAPIMTRTSRSAFTAIDIRYEQAGQTLGLKPGQVFLRVALPMARPVILSGVVLCWARAVGEFGATLMVAGATRFKTETLPIAVYLNISSGELGIALVCAWLLIMTGFLVLLVMRWIGAPLSADQSMVGMDP
jgi:molybdate transport system permease protein